MVNYRDLSPLSDLDGEQFITLSDETSNAVTKLKLEAIVPLLNPSFNSSLKYKSIGQTVLPDQVNLIYCWDKIFDRDDELFDGHAFIPKNTGVYYFKVYVEGTPTGSGGFNVPYHELHLTMHTTIGLFEEVVYKQVYYSDAPHQQSIEASTIFRVTEDTQFVDFNYQNSFVDSMNLNTETNIIIYRII